MGSFDWTWILPGYRQSHEKRKWTHWKDTSKKKLFGNTGHNYLKIWIRTALIELPHSDVLVSVWWEVKTILWVLYTYFTEHWSQFRYINGVSSFIRNIISEWWFCYSSHSGYDLVPYSSQSSAVLMFLHDVTEIDYHIKMNVVFVHRKVVHGNMFGYAVKLVWNDFNRL